MTDPSEGLRRRVIDSSWLRAMFQAGKADRFGADAWADALTYAGLRPLLALSEEEVGDAELSRSLDHVRSAGQALEAAESKVGAVRGYWPGMHQFEPIVLFLALVGGLGSLLSGGSVAFAVATFGLIAGLMVVRLLGVQVREPVGSERLARAEMAAAVKALVDHTWVTRAGDAVFENVPQADHLRGVVAKLDHTVDRARVRADELARLEAELTAVNRSLGHPDSDPELVGLRRRQASLRAEIERVQTLREQFRERLLSSEGHLERLRLLARRRAVHRRLQQLGADSEMLTRTRSEVEVDVTGFDAEVGKLAREVVDVEQRLAASVEVATL
jgi:hypothetical protein